MGLVKQRWIEMTEMNVSHVPEKKVCHRHFLDKYINKFIRANSSMGFCDYCSKKVKVVEFEELMVFVMGCISTFYEDAANFMGYDSGEGGYLGEIHTPDELIQWQIGLEADPYHLVEDVVDCIDDIAWAEPDKYYDTPRDEMMYQWDYFKRRVKHSNRFLFSNPDQESRTAIEVLKELGKLIVTSHLIRKIPAGTKIHRCRQHNELTKIDKIEHIVSPPPEFAVYSNRFSPYGISMLYSAFDEETAITETVDRTDVDSKHITIGELELVEDEYVIDFSNLPEIPGFFGITKKRKFYLLCFLHDLVNDFTQQISRDGKEHIEYIPTQIVTEFLRHPFNSKRKYKISGIIYPSSRNLKSASVFFWDDQESRKKLRLISLRQKSIY